LRHGLGPDRGAAEGGQAAASRRADDGGVVKSLQKIGVSFSTENELNFQQLSEL